MFVTWLDNNTWLWEIGGQRILLDPWLVGPLVFGNLTWLIKGDRLQSRPIPADIDLILLSQGLEDHAHPPTLKQLDRTIPVVASPNAAKVVQQLGYAHVTALAPGETWTLANHLTIQALPGSQIGPQLVENGYLLRDLQTNHTLYYEPHGSHAPGLKQLAPIDVVIAPVVNLGLPLLGPLIKGSQSALEIVQWVQPQFLLPTAAGVEVVFEGILQSLLRTTGTAADLQALLRQQNLPTQVLTPQPGERVELQLQQRGAWVA